MNEFTDRTEAELARLRGVRPARLAPGSDAAGVTPLFTPRKAGLGAAPAKLAAPPSVDWRTKGVVRAFFFFEFTLSRTLAEAFRAPSHR